MNDVRLSEWECWFQINKDGAGGFRKVFQAADEEDAWHQAKAFASNHKAYGKGDISPDSDSLRPCHYLL